MNGRNPNSPSIELAESSYCKYGAIHHFVAMSLNTRKYLGDSYVHRWLTGVNSIQFNSTYLGFLTMDID